MRSVACYCLTIVLLPCAAIVAQDSSVVPAADEYYDLGGFHYAVTTESADGQRWFDRGLAMCFGFNHEEAVRCFEKALHADPGMPMAYWGIAYAWGPNINNMEIEPEGIAKAQFAIHLANLHGDHCSDLEKELIGALSKRYATPVPEDRDPLNQAYADAMRQVHSRHNNDPLVVTLFAESLMNLQPWLHWSQDGEPGEHTAEIRKVLEAGLQHWPDYPALCHLYIHTMEASPTPEKALAVADHLRNAMPGQGHLLHMPSHIDIWLGNYGRVIEANQKAIEADKEFLKREGPLNFYSLYRIHNYHFLVYGAMFDGQSELALRTARDLKEQVPEAMVREQSDFLDAFMPTDLHVLVRFGKWEEILDQPEPADYLPVSRSIYRYARALAYAATNQVEQAEAERKAFKQMVATVPETSYLFQNQSLKILEVAKAMVDGEIAYRKDQFEIAFEHLREAVRLDDSLNYDEPWGWMQPARHALGALLLEQGQVVEAGSVYREDLRRHPNNPWALHGLVSCLNAQNKHDEAAVVHQQFSAACQRADVTIDRSCYCKLDGVTANP